MHLLTSYARSAAVLIAIHFERPDLIGLGASEKGDTGDIAVEATIGGLILRSRPDFGVIVESAHQFYNDLVVLLDAFNG